MFHVSCYIDSIKVSPLIVDHYVLLIYAFNIYFLGFLIGAAPCTALATSGDQIASVGEDGKLLIINPNQALPTRSLGLQPHC